MFVDAGAGISQEECTSQVTLTAARYAESLQIVFDDAHPFAELLRRDPQAALIRPNNGVLMSDFLHYLAISPMTRGRFAVYSTYYSQGYHPAYPPCETATLGSEYTFLIHKGHAWYGLPITHKSLAKGRLRPKDAEGCSRISGLESYDIIAPQVTAIAGGVIEIQPAKINKYG